MRMSITTYCMPVIRANNDTDVNGLDVTVLSNGRVPFLRSHLFYSLHTMRQTRALLLHQIMCQDLLLAQQEELINKIYGQLHRTTDHYLNTLNTIYNTDRSEGGKDNGER